MQKSGAECDEHSHGNGGEIQDYQGDSTLSREEGAGKEGVNRNFGGATEERGEQYGHFPVAGGRQGARSHYGRHGAAETDEQGHDAAAAEAKFAQQGVADECDPCHIAAVLKQGKEEEQQEDDGHEADYGADSGEDAVPYKGAHGRGYAPGFEGGVTYARQGGNAAFQQALKRGSYQVDGQPYYQRNHHEENRQGKELAGQDLVYGLAPAVFPALVSLHDSGAAELPYE